MTLFITPCPESVIKLEKKNEGDKIYKRDDKYLQIIWYFALKTQVGHPKIYQNNKKIN